MPTANCTIVGRRKSDGTYDLTTSAYVGYGSSTEFFPYSLKFTLPTFTGKSASVKFSLAMLSGFRNGTKSANVNLRWALCTSDANISKYNTSGTVSDSNQIVSGTVTYSGLSSSVSYKELTVSTTALESGASYCLIFWGNNSGGYIGDTATMYAASKHSAVLTSVDTYTLSISAGTGSNITVNRTASGYAGTGNIVAGTTLYYGDTLKITFTPSANYKLLTTKVNGVNFTSGNTLTITANVSVTATAQILASDVGATNSDIGSVSTITVTKYGDAYCHSLQYTFGGLSGYINSNGAAQPNEAKFSSASVAFTVPSSFYAEIPNAKTGICTITCRTYETSASTTVLGNATTCTFTVTAAQSSCSPTITATVVDTNATTTALTGNSEWLIKYMSTAECTINATGRCSASITATSIAGSPVTGTTSGDVITATKTFVATDKESFIFSATDSRGYTVTKTVNPNVVKYIKLTCNPVITRPTPTGSSIVMEVSGNIYRGSFGAYSNTLTLQYRYKEEGGSYGSWQTIDSVNITIGTTMYNSDGAISLGEEFDYHKAYEFQVKAVDGTSAYPLSTVTATVSVQRGVPVFDWGESDFDFHVPVKISDGGTLTIGNTVITEAQLKSLLAMIT